VKVESQPPLAQPDMVIDPTVANSGRAASSVKAAAAAGGGRRPAFTELAGRPYSGHRIGRRIDAVGSVIVTSFGAGRLIVLISESASRTEWRTGPWRWSTQCFAATASRHS
jgi:hypothetical protein